MGEPCTQVVAKQEDGDGQHGAHDPGEMQTGKGHVARVGYAVFPPEVAYGNGHGSCHAVEEHEAELADGDYYLMGCQFGASQPSDVECAQTE